MLTIIWANFHLFSVTAAHWSQKVIYFFFFSLRVKTISYVNVELLCDLMYLEGTQVIQWNSLSVSSEWIWTIISRGPRPMHQRSVSVLGINSSETRLNKSADLQFTKLIVNFHFIRSIKKRNVMQLQCDILRFLFWWILPILT